MRTAMLNHAGFILLALGISFSMCRDSGAIPFSVETTARKSVKRSLNGETITALTQDSEDLVFQDYAFTDQNGATQYEPRYFAFASRDSSVDDNFPQPTGRCTAGSTRRHVYWVDDHTGGVVCVSHDRVSEGNDDSYNPKLGGTQGDEGRYVFFESRASNLFTPRTPGGQQQVVVHDRKANRTFLSTSKCVPDFVQPAPTANPGSSQSVTLHDVVESGEKILISSSGTYMYDNVSPICYGVGTEGLYIRNGKNCVSPSRGDCFTSALFDRFGLHADSVLFLDSGARNAAMNADGSAVVFDSLATVPTRFNPDVSGFHDIYLHKDDTFSVVSRAQVPRCSLAGQLLPLGNINEPGNGDSIRPRIDGPGRYIVFESLANDLVVDASNPNMICKEGAKVFYPHPKSVSYINTGGVSQVYVYDEVEKKISLISKAHNSRNGGNGPSGNAWVSKDGHYIIFESSATNLLAQPTTSNRNIFMHDRIQGVTYLVTVGTGGTGLDRDATITHVSKNGLVVAYETRASNAVVASTNGGTNPSFLQHVYIAQNSCPLDIDGDGVPDCLDLCPNDLLKTEPGSCGCGKDETDSDNDLVPNCIDLCSSDPKKTVPGQCGCGAAETDTDRDSVADCADECPNDNSKTKAGSCGCGVQETDADGDGLADCKDACPTNPNRKTTNGCACTALKDSPGVCGCNVADSDSNGNGVADCLDPSPSASPAAPTIDITRTTSDSREARYQLVAMLQKYQGRVTYNVKLRRGKKVISRTVTNPFVTFNGLRKGTVELEYSVSIGSGANAVTSKTTSVAINVPGGVRASGSTKGRAGTRSSD